MKRYKKNQRKRRGSSLGEIEDTAQVMDNTQGYIETAKETGLIAISAIAGSAVGAAIGKHSLLVSIPVAVTGVYKKNLYILAAGLGLALANGFQRSRSTVQGIDGLDFKQVAQDAKDRVSTFFENFKEKLYLSKTEPAAEATATNGLGDAQEEQVTYFVNPYGSSEADTVAALPELDMSAIDRLQEQIAEMSRMPPPPTSTAGLNEVEREF